MPCHPGGRYRENTLESLLRKAGWGEVHFVSRLDRETSGAVVVAKSEAAAARLGRDMAARRFDKRYLCLVEGIWKESPGEDGWFDAFGWIRPAGDDVVRKYRVFERAQDFEAWRSCQSSESALTKFRPLWTGDGRTLLECKPETGRTAQIRATLHALGYPVAGDKLYGRDRRLYAKMCEDALTAEDLAELGLPRQALHAWKVGFPHPATREWVEAEAPPPADCRYFALARQAPTPSLWREGGKPLGVSGRPTGQGTRVGIGDSSMTIEPFGAFSMRTDS